MSTTSPSVYELNGYADRAAYLDSLAADRGIDRSVVDGLSDVLGESEDFDALVTELDDFVEFDAECDRNPWRSDFADPGGRSALRAGVREFPCPTCGADNALCAADVKLGYQCDACADGVEGRSDFGPSAYVDDSPESYSDADGGL